MRPSVLVVDDDPVFRDLARRLLAADGLEVVAEAESLAGALDAAHALRPDAVLVDIDLPDGDGLTLARRLSALPWRPRIVLTSTDPDAASPEEVSSRHRINALLMRAMDELSAAHRAVVDLTYFHELGYREIATILECPVDTVKTRMFHARRHLRRRLAGELTDWI